MPGFDGTGPLGQGPMTGRGQGFCVLTSSEENPGRLEGLAGSQGTVISQKMNSFENTGKEAINMPLGDGTGPAGMGPMTGRAAGFCAGYPVPGYMNPAPGFRSGVNPVAGRAGFYGAGAPVVGPYGTGYGMPYGGRVNTWLGRGFGRGRGRGRGGRFGYW